MFLKDSDLNSGFITGATEENFGNISYDLLIKEIITDAGHFTEYSLKPGESAFVSSVEVVNVPPDMFAQVAIRNSAIRLGLAVSAPIYQPGHKTRIFFRATNISKATITLKQKTSVCSLMGYRFKEPSSKPYSGVYADEFDYRGVGDFHSVQIPSASVLEERLKDLEKLEHRLYGNVMMLLTVFVAIFSLVNLNMSTLRSGYSLCEILGFNAMFLGAISTLVLLIAEIIGSLHKRQRLLFVVPFISLIAACLLLAR